MYLKIFYDIYGIQNYVVGIIMKQTKKSYKLDYFPLLTFY